MFRPSQRCQFLEQFMLAEVTAVCRIGGVIFIGKFLRVRMTRTGKENFAAMSSASCNSRRGKLGESAMAASERSPKTHAPRARGIRNPRRRNTPRDTIRSFSATSAIAPTCFALHSSFNLRSYRLTDTNRLKVGRVARARREVQRTIQTARAERRALPDLTTLPALLTSYLSFSYGQPPPLQKFASLARRFCAEFLADSYSGAACTTLPPSRPIFTETLPYAVLTSVNSRRNLRRSAMVLRTPNALVSRNIISENLSASASAHRTVSKTPGRFFFIWMGV